MHDKYNPYNFCVIFKVVNFEGLVLKKKKQSLVLIFVYLNNYLENNATFALPRNT